MGFPSNERLFTLYEQVAEQLTEEQIEILLRRSGIDATGQEIKDVQHGIRTVILEYIADKRESASDS